MTTQVLIVIAEPDADRERLEELSAGLRRDLLELEVDDVRRVTTGEVPPGARGFDLATAGALTLVLERSVTVASAVLKTIRGWVGGGESARTVTLTIGDRTLEMTGVTSDQQERLTAEFLRAIGHGDPP